MGSSDKPFRWASGDRYESYVGRWSRLVAREFIAWLSMSAGSRWLDVGCGTGALAQTILDLASPLSVDAVDPSGFDPSHRARLGRERHAHPYVVARLQSRVGR